MLIGKDNPTLSFLNAINSKINSLNNRNRVIIELDKMSYVEGINQKGYVTEYVKNKVQTVIDVWSPYTLDGTEETVNTTPLFVNVEPSMPIRKNTFNEMVITSRYRTKSRPNHNGIDIDLVIGDDVLSCWDGEVVDARYSTGYGYKVDVLHYNGVKSRYAHLDKILVTNGQQVTKGAVIGKGGNTGNVIREGGGDGSHLHFEILRMSGDRDNFVTIDPEPVLQGKKNVVIKPTASEVQKSRATPLEIYSIDFNKKSPDSRFTNSGANLFSTTVYDKVSMRLFGFNGLNSGQVKTINFNYNFIKESYINFEFFSKLDNNSDLIEIRMNSKLIARINKSNVGTSGLYLSPYIKVKKGTNTFQFKFSNSSGATTSRWGISKLKLGYFDTIIGTTEGTFSVDPSKPKEVDVEQKKEVWYELGGFQYEDTYYLENEIMDWMVNNHLEALSSTASFTLDNSSGVFSPDYRRADFPKNKEDSIYSYLEYGEITHLLSEGTPVRIYAGYGHELTRVFTGMIKGEIEEDSEKRTITINCVDMFHYLEDKVILEDLNFTEDSNINDDNNGDLMKGKWVKSAIVRYLIVMAGVTGWRRNKEDLQYPDLIIEETVYIDVDNKKGSFIKLDENGKPQIVSENSQKTFFKNETGKIVEGFKNYFTQDLQVKKGETISDIVQSLISDINYRIYFNRYGTFIMESLDISSLTPIWDIVEGQNLISLNSSIDYSNVRNHIIVSGSQGKDEHFFDKELFRATKGHIRTSGINVSWIDETDGQRARGAKEHLARRFFFDMKRQARTKNVRIKGNPLIDLMDVVYLYDSNTSTNGVFIVKGNKLSGNTQGMFNDIELTWLELN
jgi:hypothetical protein